MSFNMNIEYVMNGMIFEFFKMFCNKLQTNYGYWLCDSDFSSNKTNM